ncbi:MAG: GtrA family protein, partial [Ectothiorhodospiraceae bacterium]
PNDRTTTQRMASANGSPGIRETLRAAARGAPTPVRFVLVATLMATIDIVGLYALHAAGMPLYPARAVSFLLAMTAGYGLNSRFTFGGQRERGRAAEMSRFYGVFAAGGVVNYGGFLVVVEIIGAWLGTRPLWLPLLGIIAGGLAGMTCNYVLSHRLVFDQRW